MSTTPNVLLINAAKRYPPEQLARVAENATVSVITMPAFAHRYGDVAQLQLVDTLYDFGQVARAATKISRAQGLDQVIGPAERSVPAAGFIRSYFGLPGIGFETALLHSNKHLMKQRLRADGLPVTDWITVPQVSDISAAVRALGNPQVVVKPVFGAGAQNTFLVRSPDEGETLATAPEAAGLRNSGFPVIVERFVDIETEYHCDAVVLDGKVEFASVSAYLVPMLQQIGRLSGSITMEPGSAPDLAVQELHRRTVQSLGLISGVTHMEVFATASGYLIGEITCRPGGGGLTDLVQLQYGVDLWSAFTDLSIGRKPDLNVTADPRRLVQIDLPLRAGRVTALSTPDELAALPDVLKVEMAAAVGDVVDSQMNSGSTTGWVWLGLRDAADLPARLEQVRSAFTYEVEGEAVAVAAGLGTSTP